MNLDQVTTIVTHDNCPDGTASALLLHDALPDAKIVFCMPGSDQHRTMPAEPGMLFCDFSPPAERVHEFVDAGAIVLDHHKTAREVVERFGENGRFGDEKTEPGVCGAVLAYRHVWMPQRAWGLPHDVAFIARFAELAGIRDTWQRTSPDWAAACEQALVLGFVPREQLLGTSLMALSGEWPQWKTVGSILRKNADDRVARALKGAYNFVTHRGTRVIVFQGVGETSDAAELVGSGADLIVGFLYLVDRGAGGVDHGKKLVLSTRSHTGYDCGALAKHWGGGGHTAAAGFSVPVDAAFHISNNPYTEIASVLSAYEATLR